MSSNSKKMCKSPAKMTTYKEKKIELSNYEILNTNCTMIGSNNLNLETKVNYITPQVKICTKPKTDLKKPVSPREFIPSPKFNTTYNTRPQFSKESFQVKSPVPTYASNSNGSLCNMSPAYSNPSPNYPQNSVSPYNVQISSPANSVSSISSGVQGIKSPVPSPQNIRPPTPQPILPQAFQQIPVMTSGPNLVQIIHTQNQAQNYQNHPMLARQTIIAPQQQTMAPQPIIKIKPPLNILPKPPSTSGNSKTPRPTSQPQPIASPSQQIVLPNQILPTAQTAGTLVLNQMPLIVQQNTAQGVQLILRPGTPTSGQLTGKIPQNLILQQSPTQQPTVLIQHGNRSQTLQQPQQLVRVLTANGMIQGLAPTYIAMNNQQLNIQQISTQPVVSQTQPQQAHSPQIKSQVNLTQGIINACIPQAVNSVVGTSSPGMAPVTSSIEQLPPPKRKPKKKKKKEPKLDLANIMKLSGIGDDDDIHFESDASESALTDQIPKTPKSEHSAPSTPELETQLSFPKRIGNIHISAVTQDISKISQNTTQTNAILEKHFTQTSQISVQQSLSDINAINQNLTQIGILNQNAQNFLGGNQLNINTPNLLNQDTQSLQNFLQALHQNSFLNGQVSSSVIPVSSMPGLTTFSTSQPSSSYPKFAVATSSYSTNMVPSISTPNENILSIPKFSQAQARPTVSPAPILSTQAIQNLGNPNILAQNTQNATILTQNSQNATLLAQNSQNNTILSSQNATILTQNSQNATLLAQNSQNATLLAQNSQNNTILSSQNATILAQNSQNATLLAQNSQNATLLAQNSQNNTILSSQNTILAQNSQNATLLTQNSQNNTILNSQNTILNSQNGAILANSQNGILNNQNLLQNQQSGTILAQNSQNGTILTQNSQNSTILAQNTQNNTILGNQIQNLNQFNISNQIPNIQVQNFGNQNLFLNQGTNTIIAPNIPNFGGNITINNGLIPNANITIPNNIVPNFVQTNIVQQQDIPNNLQRTGGFKLALSEDGRLILQHDPNLNQDIQSQLLLQSIFGINIPGNNLVLTSVNQPVIPTPKPIAVVEPKKQEITNTKTTSIIQNSIPSVRTENPCEPPPNNFSYIVNLTPDQLEILKRNGQLTVNGQTIFMHRPKNPENDKNKSPKAKTIKRKPFEPKPKIIQEIKSDRTPSLISALQSPIKLDEPKEFAQNVACVQPNNSKIAPQIIKPDLSPKKPKEDKKIEKPEKKEIFENGDMNVNVEQFLSNLNINPTNLGQLISQKLPGVDHKIVNITQGSTPGHIVAKIDINPENMQLLSNEVQNNTNAVPPLVSMKPDPPENTFNVTLPSEVPQPNIIISNPNGTLPPEVTNTHLEGQSTPTTNRNTVYQRIQTIQLTPQKQQLLRSVQLQIQTLSARLQEKKTLDAKTPDSVPDSEIRRTLNLLFVEQQKILATGKVIPTIQQPVASINSNVDSVPTQTVPVTTASKNNNTYLTSLLQQPVVSHNQKVFYHHGNQIIAINQQQQQPSASNNSNLGLKVKKLPSPGCSTQTNVGFITPSKVEKVQISTQTEKNIVPNSVLLSPKKITKPTYSKAQLIEQQMTTDQNGAMNPDITTPFANKADACKRLVRYHCYNQPVLSQKDLNKADEIFELTARHFIEKFKVMVNKYKFLLLKESMREVQTSELMMIDRMFLAEEQQSLLKAQSDLKHQNELDVQQSIETTLQEMYGEDIKPKIPTDINEPSKSESEKFELQKSAFTVKTEEKSEFDENPDFNIKCGLNYFSDGSCESSNFQVYEENPKFEDFISKDEFDTEKKEGYNTTKIIGNFEIEINNKSCNNQESFTKNFRQKIIDKEKNLEMFEKPPEQTEEQYDEWLCIQRELGYFPDNKEETKPEEPPQEFKPKIENDVKKTYKRTSSDSSRLETLKKFRVEKHNSKVKKTGSIIGEVKFEVRIEHKKVFPEKKDEFKGNKRNFDYPKDDYGKRVCVNQNFNNHNIKEEAGNDNEENFDRSIDEQVQSAIDSILNLQQITSMNTDKGECSKTDFGTKSEENESSLDEAVKSILS